MSLVLTTYDWVPERSRGLVRDLRVRWLFEELGRPYSVETVRARDKSDAHRESQPFQQVPFIRDGDLTLFESGAILLHYAEGTDLMPAARRPHVLQWLIAALNSVEPFGMAWSAVRFADNDEAGAARQETRLRKRLALLQAALGDRAWLTGDGFTAADLLMADVLRGPAQNGFLDDLHGLAGFVERATDRPAFRKAMADHMAHWQAADARVAAG